MKIILTRDVKGLGQSGDIKEVKGGYANNFLLPKKFALVANKKNIEAISEKRAKKQETKKKVKPVSKKKKVKKKAKDNISKK